MVSKKSLHLLFILTAAFSSSLQAGDLPTPPMSVARGFKKGHCYSHVAVRRCTPSVKSKALKEGLMSCKLEIFPDSNGAMGFKLTGDRDVLIPNKKTTDFGVFVFEVTSSNTDYSPAARVRSKKSITLKEYEDRSIKSYLAQEVPCR